MAAGNTKMEKLLNTFSIDLILTNHKQYFMKSQTLATGIYDFHALTLS